MESISNTSVTKADGNGAAEGDASAKLSNNDEDLDDLLDSALEDFEKGLLTQPGEKKHDQEKIVQEGDASQAASSGDISDEQEALFNELFSAAGDGDSPEALEEMMKKLMSGQPEIFQQLENIAQNLETIVPPDAGSTTVDSTLQQTLEGLAQNVQGLQEEPQEEDILHLLSELKTSDDGASGSTPDWDIIPMMQNMMKSIMSKEVLYPSLKDIADKYPKWLEDNSAKLNENELQNYRKQYELMKTIVHEYEREKTDDSEDVKSRRFEKIMDIMQKMQELGQPPKDLVGEMPPGIDIDENGLPKFPGSPDQCSVM